MATKVEAHWQYVYIYQQYSKITSPHNKHGQNNSNAFFACPHFTCANIMFCAHACHVFCMFILPSKNVQLIAMCLVTLQASLFPLMVGLLCHQPKFFLVLLKSKTYFPYMHLDNNPSNQ